LKEKKVMTEDTAAGKVSEMPRHGEFCWTEIATDQAEACKNFYSEVFGWQFNQSNSTGAGTEYLEFGTEAENQFGGLFQMKTEWYGGAMPRPHMNIYIAVADVDTLAAKASELGGTIVGPAMDVPNVGRISQIQDPTGAKFFIVTLKS
jgi:predicted enzyme related to lactoylglutathione lyase